MIPGTALYARIWQCQSSTQNWQAKSQVKRVWDGLWAYAEQNPFSPEHNVRQMQTGETKKKLKTVSCCARCAMARLSIITAFRWGNVKCFWCCPWNDPDAKAIHPSLSQNIGCMHCDGMDFHATPAPPPRTPTKRIFYFTSLESTRAPPSWWNKSRRMHRIISSIDTYISHDSSFYSSPIRPLMIDHVMCFMFNLKPIAAGEHVCACE